MSTKKPRFSRNILKEADLIINANRPEKYGDVGESFNRVADIATLMFTPKELQFGGMTAQKVVKVMQAIKMSRDVYSPDNPDHLRDLCGYTELLDQLRQLGID